MIAQGLLHAGDRSRAGDRPHAGGWRPDGREGPGGAAPAAGDGTEAVLTASVMVATVFRLRDEDGLLHALRGLAEAVAGWEQEGESADRP